MAFVDNIKKGIEIIKLNKEVSKEVAKDENATMMGILIVALAGVAAAVGGLNPLIILFAVPAVLFGSFIGVGIYHILAKLFGGTADFMEFYRATSHTYVAQWISAIPMLGFFLSPLIMLWMIVVNVVILESVHELSRGKAIMVVLIPIIILVILAAILAVTMGAMIMAIIAQGSMDPTGMITGLM